MQKIDHCVELDLHRTTDGYDYSDATEWYDHSEGKKYCVELDLHRTTDSYDYSDATEWYDHSEGVELGLHSR